MVDWQFLPQNFGQVVRTYKGLLCSMNADVVGIVLSGGGDTSTLHVIMELVQTFCTEKWWE